MLRPLAFAVLVLAGCLGAPAATTLPPALPVADDGVDVVAIRVDPLVHAIDLQGRLDWHACSSGVSSCHRPGSLLAGTTGVEWDIDVHDYADAQALFWRVALDLERVEGTGPVFPLKLEVSVTKPCGVLCVQERRIEMLEGGERVQLAPRDVFLEPGETGLRVRVLPADGSTPSTTEVRYALQGYAAGFRAAGPAFQLA